MPLTASDQTRLLKEIEAATLRIEASEGAFENLTLGELVARRAKTHGSKIAINVFERGEKATYADVDRLSNVFANKLRNFGVVKGDRIAVCLPNRIEYPVLWFAIAKIGAVIVPVNVRYTPREIEYVLNDTSARFAVLDATAWPNFEAIESWPTSLPKGNLISVGESLGSLVNLADLPGADASPDVSVAPDDLLNIQYTSGTTGFPKGCMLTHEYWMVSACGSALQDRQPYDRYLCWQTFLYVDAQMQIMRSFWQGGTYYLASQMSSSKFLDWIIEHKIDWCAFPELVTRQPEEPRDNTTTLKIVHFQGGWNGQAMQRFRERYGVQGFNNYGMTETGWSTMMPCFIDYNDAPFGIRAPFRKLKIVGPDGATAAPGEVGEMWVSGRGVFKGYWEKPEANASSFEGEWFKTGDLMRQDELGFFWLVGRTKEMIRRSGENIAAREVEAVLREIHEIEDVAAIPVKDLKRGEEVKVVIELKGEIIQSNYIVDKIIEHANERLARFKQPRFIQFVEALPRTTSSNKVRKSDLINLSEPQPNTYDCEKRAWL